MFNVNRPMMALYAEGMSTIVNMVIIILEHGSSPNVTCWLTIPREIESLVNLVGEEAIGVRSLVVNPSF